MRIELLNDAGAVVGMIDGVVDVAEPPRHYQFYSGAVSWREVDPAVVEAEIIARQKEERLKNALLHGVVLVLFNHDNRIRALENKMSLTLDQFKSALKQQLGL